MPVAGPFYLAYVDYGTAFNPAVHNVMDEYVFGKRRILQENQKPLLELEIRNPHIGLLNVARKTWAYFSWLNPSNGLVEPLFLGRVVATPGSVFNEIIRVQFVTWPVDYFQRVQRLAETLKNNPYYDQVFIAVEKQDDPDTILEARNEFFCVDPITMNITSEDIINGSDGNVDITADVAFYDGFDMRVKEAPLTQILMDATVSWTQTARGYIDVGNRVVNLYSGDGWIADWPKALTVLGGGWSVKDGVASDLLRVSQALTGSFEYHWKNGSKTHNDGDALSLDISVTAPQSGSSYLSKILTERQQQGFLDPFATDGDGDPSPINIPASYQNTTAYVPSWSIGTSLTLRYDAERPRTERVLILLRADVQAIINDPLITQSTEVITRTGRDVGVPIVNLLNWTSVSGQHVDVGQVVFPDNPSIPGEHSAQIAVVAGTAGADEPDFSDVVGVPTVDGGVTWASLGTQSPTRGALDWTGLSNVPVGEIITPRVPLSISARTLVQPGLAQFPQVGVQVALGEIVDVGGGDCYACVLDGISGVGSPFGGTAQWTHIGQLPDGRTSFICVQQGQTGALYVIPPFGSSVALHSTVSDGSVVWVNIGVGDVPAGGSPGNVWANSYFRSYRGRRSLEYLMAILRAHIRNRARAVEIDFECPYAQGVHINCRKTVTLHDTRIPGGVAVGKVVRAELYANGDGENLCRVTIACCVGLDTVIVPTAGVGAYAAPGYMQSGYQQEIGGVQLLTDLSDVAYTPLTDGPNDDGITFPLDRGQAVLSENVKSIGDQSAAIRSALASMARAAQVAQLPVGSIAQSIINQRIEILAQGNSVSHALQLNPVYYELQLRPLNQPFFDVYKVATQPVTLPMGIDLRGASTP